MPHAFLLLVINSIEVPDIEVVAFYIQVLKEFVYTASDWIINFNIIANNITAG